MPTDPISQALYDLNLINKFESNINQKITGIESMVQEMQQTIDITTEERDRYKTNLKEVYKHIDWMIRTDTIDKEELKFLMSFIANLLDDVLKFHNPTYTNRSSL